MPQQDKTGPTGKGPMTGRGAGFCGRRTGLGRGYGRAMGGWFHRKYQEMPKEEREELLKSEIDDLKQEMQMVKNELKEL